MKCQKMKQISINLTRSPLRFLSIVAVFCIPLAQANAGALSTYTAYTEVTDGFNAFIIGDVVDYSLSGADQTDIEGALAVGGSLYGTGGQIPSLTVGYKTSLASGYDGTQTTLVVRGDLNNRNNTVFGSTWVGGNATLGAGDPAGMTMKGNLTVGGTLDYNSSDAGGNIGKDVFLNGGSAAVKIGGEATFGEGSNVFGTVETGGTITVNGVGMGDATLFPVSAPSLDPSPVDFDAMQTALESESAAMSTLTTANAAPNVGTPRLTNVGDLGNGLGNNHTGVYLDASFVLDDVNEPVVFNLGLTDAFLGGQPLWGNGFTIFSDIDQEIIINVSGLVHTITDFGFFISPILNLSNIVFNFFEATDIFLGDSQDQSGIGFKGNLLAPFAHVNFYNGLLEGDLIAMSLTGDGQINTMDEPDYEREDLPVPGLLWLVVFGAGGILGLRRYRTT